MLTFRLGLRCWGNASSATATTSLVRKLHRSFPSRVYSNNDKNAASQNAASSPTTNTQTPTPTPTPTKPPAIRVNLNTIKEKYQLKQPLTMVTAYDYTSARVCSAAEVDMVLVGDSCAQVMLGYDSTTQITMDEMISHCSAVTRTMDRCHTTLNMHRPLVVCDLPFGSYTTTEDALKNAVRAVKEGGADAVKLEGGLRQPVIMEQVQAIIDSGIAVMGHTGLLPQTCASFTVQGKTADDAMALFHDTEALANAGCFAIVLEMVPGKVAEAITSHTIAPTIGIGAGPHTSGQVLVFHDIVGAFDRFVPKFSKQYTDINTAMIDAVSSFRGDVQAAHFPTKEHTFLVKKQELARFKENLQDNNNHQTTPSFQQRRSMSTIATTASTCKCHSSVAFNISSSSLPHTSFPSTIPLKPKEKNLLPVVSSYDNVSMTAWNLQPQPSSSYMINNGSNETLEESCLAEGSSTFSSLTETQQPSQPPIPHVAVVGGGALGTLIAAVLGGGIRQTKDTFQSLVPSLITSWREHATAIREQGGILLSSPASPSTTSFTETQVDQQEPLALVPVNVYHSSCM